MPKTIYNNRRLPFDVTLSTSLGDDISLQFTLRDEDGVNITTGTPLNFTLVIKEAPSEGEDLADKTTVCTIVQAGMTISLPTVDLIIDTSADWSTQEKGKFYAALRGEIDTNVVTPHEFIIEVVD